jgi:synaptic vesicle membrane protein VAT-1
MRPLVHNAGGGVGLAAIDIARHIRATIYLTASSGKHAFLKPRGLHEAIDYRTKDWAVELDRKLLIRLPAWTENF